MIDTIKIHTSVSDEVYQVIESKTDVVCKLNFHDKIIYYKIIRGSLEGSYGSHLAFRISERRYGIRNCLELEGSYHKLVRGYNSHNGFYDIREVVQGIIDLLSNGFGVNLPPLKQWFVQRIDISFVYDLLNQENVKNYINNNRYLVYPRRKTQYFLNECVYFAGSRTTLKIYNKLVEFCKHDFRKLLKFNDFNVDNYIEEIKGFVRFECEIRKKKLVELLGNNDIDSIDMNVLNDYVVGDFMKLFKINSKNLCIVRDQNEVKNLLYSKYKECKARRLFGFFLTCVNDGMDVVKEQFSSSSYYRNIEELKDCGIDFTQQAFVVEKIKVSEKFIDFTPFTNNSKFKEVV